MPTWLISKDVGCDMWQLASKALEQRVSLRTFREVIKRTWRAEQPGEISTSEDLVPDRAKDKVSSCGNCWTTKKVEQLSTLPFIKRVKNQERKEKNYLIFFLFYSFYSTTGVNNSRRCSALTTTLPVSSTSTMAVSPSLMRPDRISSARLSSNNRIIARRNGLAP